MKTLKSDWLIWLVITLPFILVAVLWDKFPEQIPTHFDMDGTPNRYSSKITGLILFPGINVLLYFLFIVIPIMDPSRKNYSLFQDKFKIIRTALHTFLSFIFMITIFYSLGYLIDISMLVMYGVTSLFLIIGNYLGNVRHNYFIGVRTPWTLANEEVWLKTHRMAAKIWVAGSLLMMALLPFLSKEITGIAFVFYVAGISLIPIIYSYLIFKKINTNN